MNRKHALSTKLLYWLTEISFKLYTVVLVGIFVLLILALSNYPVKNMFLHVQAPFEFALVKSGVLSTSQGDLEIILTKGSARIGIKNTPSFLIKPLAVAAFVMASLFFMVIFAFRQFVKGVYRKGYFEINQSFHLRNMAIWLSVIWLCSQIYFVVFSSYLKNNIQLDGIVIQSGYQTSGSVLFLALVIWVISHMVKQGYYMSNELEHTV